MPCCRAARSHRRRYVAELDAAGVDGAILVSAFTMYRYDASYALEVHSRHPARFAARQAGRPGRSRRRRVIADWKRTPGAVGVRMLLARSGLADRRRRSRPQPRAGDGGAALAARQPAHRRSARPGHRADPPQSRYADHRRSPGPGAAARAAGAGRALGRAAEGADARRSSTTSPSRSPARARCRARPTLSTTSGTRCAA